MGKLQDIAHARARIPNGRSNEWHLQDFHRTWPSAIHVQSGQVVNLPWMVNAPLGELSLLEIRSGTFVQDLAASILIVDGQLRITGLAPGDYSLRFRRDNREVAIRVTNGKPVQNWVLSPNRLLEVRDAAPLHLESMKFQDNGITIQLKNWDKFTRVHVASSRFLPESGLFR